MNDQQSKLKDLEEKVTRCEKAVGTRKADVAKSKAQVGKHREKFLTNLKNIDCGNNTRKDTVCEA